MSKEEAQFEELLAMHCAPVLKCRKIANMFHVWKSQFQHVEQLIKEYELKLKKCGIYFCLFQGHCQRVTIYVYRKQALKLRLHQSNVDSFLSNYGYPESDDLNETFQFLNQRICKSCNYPHEIGIFLGYPLEDVEGFIHQRPCKLIGYWKVYGDVERAKTLFQQYDSYRNELLIGIHNGNRIEQLLIN